MSQRLIAQQIRTIRASIMAGLTRKAAEDVEHLMHLLTRHPPGPADRDALERQLAELRSLAEAAFAGAQAAAEQVRAILQTARSLETYDQRGQRKIADTAAAQPRRF